MHPERHLGEVQRLAVGPDPRDALHRSFADGDGEVGEIGIGRRRGAGAAALAADGLPAHHLLERLRPDHGAGEPNPP